MLLTESERAKELRTRILDIVIATINRRAGGGTKYINWRDRDYLPTAIKSENYRKNFTQAVGKYVDGIPTYKYEQITDLIYKAVFRENAKEYRVVLRLQNEENVRHTLYAEVLLCISSFENGVAHQIEKMYSENGNKQLSIEEVKAIIYHVAAGRIDKELLQRIITCFMANEDYPEDLKLEIIHAIDDQSTGFNE